MLFSLRIYVHTLPHTLLWYRQLSLAEWNMTCLYFGWLETWRIVLSGCDWREMDSICRCALFSDWALTKIILPRSPKFSSLEFCRTKCQTAIAPYCQIHKRLLCLAMPGSFRFCPLFFTHKQLFQLVVPVLSFLFSAPYTSHIQNCYSKFSRKGSLEKKWAISSNNVRIKKKTKLSS